MGVRASGGVPGQLTQQLLFKLTSANFQSTSDQTFTRIYGGTSFFIGSIVARQRTGGASVACAGGVYDGAGKTGNIIVAAAQSWVTLASGVIVTATLGAPATTILLTNTPILSLTTGSTAAITGDVYIYGFDLT
jgi:hypothetical protein